MIKCEKTIRVWFGRDNRLGFHLRLLPSLSLGQYHKDVGGFYIAQWRVYRYVHLSWLVWRMAVTVDWMEEE